MDPDSPVEWNVEEQSTFNDGSNSHVLGVEEDTSVSSGSFVSAKEDLLSSGDEMEDLLSEADYNFEGKTLSEKSSDCGYGSSSEEDKIRSKESVTEGESLMRRQIYDEFNFDDMPEDLQQLITGVSSGLPVGYNPPVDRKPEWFDLEKYQLGQSFAKKYYIGVNLSEMLSLYMLFALPGGLETLIFTKKSSTPFTSFQRYLSTVLRVTSWYDYDIWDKSTLGYKNLKAVLGMHQNVSTRINSIPYEELKSQLTLAGSTNNAPVWSNLKDLIQKDFQVSQSGCPFNRMSPEDKAESGKTFINQLDMGTTQFGFMGLIVTSPEKFGAGNATKEELDGFVHLWRCIGYLLGTEDKYNFCAGSFEGVKQRSQAVIDKWVKPSLQNVTEEWEHMSRSLAEGMSYVTSTGGMFESSLLYMCWVLDVPSTHLYKSLSWGHTCSFYVLRFVINTVTRFPGALAILNWYARRSIYNASIMSSDGLKELEEKQYDYHTIETSQREEVTRGRKFPTGALLGLIVVARVMF